MFDEYDIAVSSPIKVRGKNHIKNTTPHKENILKTAIQGIREDLTGLNMNKEHLSQPMSGVFSQDVEFQIISGAEHPQIVAVNGIEVPYEVIRRNSPHMIINKTCGVRDFEEFYLWFSRNEIHEYVFAKIEYHKVDQTFFFNGHLLPKKMVHRKDIETRYRAEIKKIKSMVDMQTQFKIYVSTLPSLVIKIHLESSAFPYRIFDDFTGLSSVFVYVEEDVECPAHLLDRVKGIRYNGRKPLQERIYQIFI